MMKFFIILLIIPALIVFGLYFLMRRARKVFYTKLNNHASQNAFTKEREKNPGKDVLYSKDNITVLKGEAKDSR